MHSGFGGSEIVTCCVVLVSVNAVTAYAGWRVTTKTVALQELITACPHHCESRPDAWPEEFEPFRVPLFWVA